MYSLKKSGKGLEGTGEGVNVSLVQGESVGSRSCCVLMCLPFTGWCLLSKPRALHVVCQVRLRDEPTFSLPPHGVTITMERRHEGIGPTLE